MSVFWLSIRLLFAAIPAAIIGFGTWVLSQTPAPPWGGSLWFIVLPPITAFAFTFAALRGLGRKSTNPRVVPGEIGTQKFNLDDQGRL